MTHYIFPHHMIPFLGSDQQAYLMNEEGEIMKVGFLNERSNMYWGRLKPGASIQLPDEETELIHVMNEISQREEFISPSIHIVTDDPFSKKLEAKFEQSGFFISSTGQKGIHIAFSGFFNCDSFQRFSDDAQENQLHWLPLYFDGRIARVGPLLGPYLQFEDLRKRLLAAAYFPDVTDSLWKAAQTAPFSEYHIPLVHLEWLLTQISWIVHDYSSANQLRLHMHQISLDPVNMETKRHPILKVPSPIPSHERKDECHVR
ncbi:hypothetical protein [Bacillus haynesii]|uniref:hypothetical protein n=1 Tax=Bacillus haynesii TaxID=1925021 RepID=UPI00227FE034|nr:hypothetical protein [Bacillus haynesii]MCY8224567.1 hypothetical protein [Bacillus haynesii]